MSDGLTELPIQSSGLWGEMGPLEGETNLLAPSDYFGTPADAGAASGSLWAGISNLAASVGSTVNNVLNAQKFGYFLSPSTAPQGTGTVAVPQTQKPLTVAGLSLSSGTILLVAIAVLILLLVRK